MAQTIRRQGQTVRKQAARQGTRRKVGRARAHTSSFAGVLARALPFTEEQLHSAFLTLILLGGLALALFVANLAGLGALAGAQVAQASRSAGFEVRKVEVHGVARMNELKIYDTVLSGQSQAMTEVDLGELRKSLMELNWVKEASVSRRLPDTLVVDVVERTPHAVLERADRLVLIDPEGHELEPVSREAAKGKLVISGPGAQQQVMALTRLLDAAPAMRPQVHEAEWVGNRRWNLTFGTGQVLALPEGDKRSAIALIDFARMDGVNRLIGGKAVAFDMRNPNRIYLRVPGRAQESLAAKDQS